MERTELSKTVPQRLLEGALVASDSATGMLMLSLRKEPPAFSFEELNGTNGVHFKTLHQVKRRMGWYREGEWLSPELGDVGITESLSNEFAALRAQRSIAPLFVPDVFGSIYIRDSFFGYLSEEVRGRHIEALVQSRDIHALAKAVRQLSQFVAILHRSGLPHGDLEGNVMVTRQNELKVIDPIGYHPGMGDLNGHLDPKYMASLKKVLMSDDLQDLAWYRGRLRSISSS